MNLLEQIKEKARLAKFSISRLLNPQGGMRFPTTSQDLSKSTEIAQRESDLGYYDKQGSGIIQGEGFNELKNKLGLNYQDAQVEAWQRGLKLGDQSLAAAMGNNPAFADFDITGGLQSVGKKAGQKVAQNVIKPVTNNIIDNITSQAKKYKTADEFVKAQDKNVYYHGTSKESALSIANSGFNFDKLGERARLNKLSGGFMGVNGKELPFIESKGISITPDYKYANKYANSLKGSKGRGEVLRLKINGKLLKSNSDEFFDMSSESFKKTKAEGLSSIDNPVEYSARRQEILNKMILDKGYVAVEPDYKYLKSIGDKEPEIKILDPRAIEVLPSKSQLTDIWNKANAPKNIFEGFKDLSTKLVEDLKGKSTVNKSFIEQRLASSDLNLKQVEKDLIRSKLANYPDRLDVKDFAENIKTDLLPLKINKSGTKAGLDENMPGGFSEFGNYRYENITLTQELRGNVAKYAEHIYESPVKTSAGDVHFRNQTENYFGHTRIEDLADSSLDKALHKQGGTRRVIEVQSDLYQKGRLENEFANFKDETLGGRTSIKDLKQIQETNKQLLNQAEKNGNIKMIEELNLEIKNTEQKLQNLIKGDYQKLSQYNDPTAHYRMVREEVKLAAQDGKTKLQFPTGETAMKIEGLGEQSFFKSEPQSTIKLIPEQLKVGREIYQHGGDDAWIITDVLEDGKFKAMPKDKWEISQNRLNGSLGEDRMDGFNLTQYQEQFDISGKVDTNNPIYKFYEKNLGKYLKSKYDAKLITDKQGVNWYELDIKPEWKNLPVEAFGFSSIQQMVKTGLLIGGGLVAQDVIRNKKKEPTREEALEALKQRRNDVALEKEDIPSFAESITPQVNINKRIEDDGRWVDLIKNNSGENVSSRLLSALLMTENRGTLAADSINENIKKDGTKNYDVGLFQHNSPVLVDKNEPVEEREYQGTQKDMNKLFKAKYGRNYDVYNPEDNTKATVLFVQDLIRRTGGKLEDVIGSYNKGVRGHSLSPNQKYIDTFIGYYNE